MRGASPRGDVPRGAYRVIGDQITAQVIASCTASATFGAVAMAAGQAVSHTDALDESHYSPTILGQMVASVTSEDQKSALAQASAILVEYADSGLSLIGSETGSTPTFAFEDTQAQEAYTAAAMAYGHTVGATTAADAMSATAKALASYADRTFAGDWATGRGSSDTTGPLRGAINITAALRGGVWFKPSPGPKGGRPH